MDIISSNLNTDDKNAWRTDPLVFDALNSEFNFKLDVAASHENALCETYLTKEINAIEQNWAEVIKHSHGDDAKLTAWCNPPYGRGMIKPFMQKAIEQKAHGVTTVLLVPATIEANWLPINDVNELRIVVGGRLSFYHPTENRKINGNTRGSMFVIFRPNNEPLVTRYIYRNELLRNKVAA